MSYVFLFAINYFKVWSPLQTSFASCYQSLDFIPIAVFISRKICLIFLAWHSQYSLSVNHVSLLSLPLLGSCYSWTIVESSTMIREFFSESFSSPQGVRMLRPFPYSLRRNTTFVPCLVTCTDFSLCFGQSCFYKEYLISSEFSFCLGEMKSPHLFSCLLRNRWGYPCKAWQHCLLLLSED